ncbi:uncharacterized protein LOC119662429 [Teleopsis dalmanni]|uniref:uncharacterized protein LOC119662429 n=1 Tax=Teleopsis dalmanni TaxID=139649 RepID=UPI0018CFD0B1|nr:uncharacterized protein LOC119662429 [Teleopsis dalmanni]
MTNREEEDFFPAEGESRTDKEVYRVSVKPMMFSREHPDLFFLQMEAQFRNAGITKDDTMFDHVVASLEPKYLECIVDVIRDPPKVLKYETLKKRLIYEFTESEHKRLRKLLTELELGDMKPTQLLKKMKEMAGNSMNDDVLKSLWLQRLPVGVRTIVAAVEGDSAQWAKVADKVFEVQETETVCVVQRNEPKEMRKEIDELKVMINNLVIQLSKRGRSNDRDRGKGRSSSARRGNICFYHRRFKERSTKCVQPCQYKPPQNSAEN